MNDTYRDPTFDDVHSAVENLILKHRDTYAFLRVFGDKEFKKHVTIKDRKGLVEFVGKLVHFLDGSPTIELIQAMRPEKISQIFTDALGAVDVYKDVYSQSDNVLPFKPIFEKTLKEFVTLVDEARTFLNLKSIFEIESKREKASADDVLAYEKIKNSWSFPDYLKTDTEISNYLKAKELFYEKVRNSEAEQRKRELEEKKKAKEQKKEEVNKTEKPNDQKVNVEQKVKVEQKETMESETTVEKEKETITTQKTEL